MKERYKVLKKIYPYYLILIKKNNKYYTFYEDKLIYKNIKNLNNINYIVLNNLEIETKKEYEKNNYLYYYTKYKLINLLERRMLNEI